MPCLLAFNVPAPLSQNYLLPYFPWICSYSLCPFHWYLHTHHILLLSPFPLNSSGNFQSHISNYLFSLSYNLMGMTLKYLPLLTFILNSGFAFLSVCWVSIFDIIKSLQSTFLRQKDLIAMSYHWNTNFNFFSDCVGLV